MSTTGDPAGREATALRGLFSVVGTCLAGGASAIAEAMRFEARAPAPGDEARAVWEAARPDSARWLVRAHEAAFAAIAAGEGTIGWRVTARAFELYGQPVWQPPPNLERLLPRLFASGVRSMGLRRGVTLLEVSELLRVLAGAAELDPRFDGELAGVLWEAGLPHLLIEADDDPLGAFEGDASSRELDAERTAELARLGVRDAAAIEQRHQAATVPGGGRPAPFTAIHEALMEILMRLPANARRRAEAEALFSAKGEHFGLPRAQALHIDDETRLDLVTDIEADPIVAVERSAVTAARAWLYGGSPTFGGALRVAVDRLAAAEPTAALALVHVACGSLEGPVKQASPNDEPEPEVRRALAHAWVTPAALARILVAAAPDVAPPGHGGAPPAAVMAVRVRDLVRRLGDACALAVLEAFPRVTEPLVRDELARYLVQVGGGIIGPIAALVASAPVEPAVALIRVLVGIGTRPALDAIAAAGQSPYPLVRVEALSYLEGASSERLRVELKAVLEDAEPSVRIAALRVIADNRIMAASAQLAHIAKDEAFDDLLVAARRAVLVTLAVLLPARAEAICLEHLEKAALLPRASREETRELAAELLGDITLSPEAEAALLAVGERKWRNTERLRAVALQAAQRIARRRAHAEGRELPVPMPNGGGPR